MPAFLSPGPPLPPPPLLPHRTPAARAPARFAGPPSSCSSLPFPRPRVPGSGVHAPVASQVGNARVSAWTPRGLPWRGAGFGPRLAPPGACCQGASFSSLPSGRSEPSSELQAISVPGGAGMGVVDPRRWAPSGLRAAGGGGNGGGGGVGGGGGRRASREALNGLRDALCRILLRERLPPASSGGAQVGAGKRRPDRLRHPHRQGRRCPARALSPARGWTARVLCSIISHHRDTLWELWTPANPPPPPPPAPPLPQLPPPPGPPRPPPPPGPPPGHPTIPTPGPFLVLLVHILFLVHELTSFS